MDACHLFLHKDHLQGGLLRTWNRTSIVSSHQLNSCFFSLQVPKLIEGREYIIRIMAQNIYGISDPLESVETKARDIYSRS